MPDIGEWWPISEAELEAAERREKGITVTGSQFIRAFGEAFRQTSS